MEVTRRSAVADELGQGRGPIGSEDRDVTVVVRDLHDGKADRLPRRAVAFADRMPYQITSDSREHATRRAAIEKLTSRYQRPRALFDDRVGTRGD